MLLIFLAFLKCCAGHLLSGMLPNSSVVSYEECRSPTRLTAIRSPCFCRVLGHKSWNLLQSVAIFYCCFGPFVDIVVFPICFVVFAMNLVLFSFLLEPLLSLFLLLLSLLFYFVLLYYSPDYWLRFSPLVQTICTPNRTLHVYVALKSMFKLWSYYCRRGHCCCCCCCSF